MPDTRIYANLSINGVERRARFDDERQYNDFKRKVQQESKSLTLVFRDTGTRMWLRPSSVDNVEKEGDA